MEQHSSWERDSRSAGQEIPHLLWNPKFEYVFKIARHWTISWARLIQYVPSHSGSLDSHLILGHLSGLFPSGFVTKLLYVFLIV